MSDQEDCEIIMENELDLGGFNYCIGVYDNGYGIHFENRDKIVLAFVDKTQEDILKKVDRLINKLSSTTD
ncbi:MAG: hypothetical protein BTN85_1608 [Candidatus Methanohalarchaeum thermophilum]|uniref:Uncharacterized protein n=1 Tax=Methanohalarchaeum thermophilum TaxID=1903181 RepID=A0A1Q6DXR0_METT1|nr:MAG: hypothetical protein BTN85_1608 [Candidatus Methanohalarchaeum thermophilum]